MVHTSKSNQLLQTTQGKMNESINDSKVSNHQLNEAFTQSFFFNFYSGKALL
jgi:hypothetical protein